MSGAFLALAHTGLHHIHHIVAQFLALVDKVHVDGAHTISVEMVVDVVDVAVFIILILCLRIGAVGEMEGALVIVSEEDGEFDTFCVVL